MLVGDVVVLLPVAHDDETDDNIGEAGNTLNNRMTRGEWLGNLKCGMADKKNFSSDWQTHS